MLLPYNCLLLGQPYYDDHAFKGMRFPFTSMISYSGFLCVSQALLTFKGEDLTLDGRMVVSTVGTVILCAALLLSTLGAHAFHNVAMYIILLAECATLGVLNAVMQTAIQGFAATIGQEMSGACMVGFGISGLISLVLSLLVQAVDIPIGVSQETNGLVVTIVGFAFCFFYTIASGWVYRLLCRHVPQAVAAIQRVESRRTSTRSSSPNIGSHLTGGSPRQPAVDAISLHSTEPLRPEQPGAVKNFGGPPSPQSPPFREASSKGEEAHSNNANLLSVSVGDEATVFRRTLVVLKEVAPQALNVWLVFAVSMSVFPGVLTQWNPGHDSYFKHSKELFGTILIGCFQVFDVVGRSLASSCRRCIAPSRLWIWVALRLVFVPLFILGQRAPHLSVLWGSDAGRIFLSAALATTNGLLASCAMMFGPERCAEDRREVAGIAMSCSMVCGILSGSLLALLTQL